MSLLGTLRKKKFLIGGFLLLALFVVPISLFFIQQKQVTQSNAEKSVDLTFEPSTSQTSPQLEIPAGSTFSLDVYVDPGSNSVSYVKLVMLYDQTKFKPAGGFIADQDVFSQIVEGPVDTPGQVTATLSVGTDLSKALKTKTKVGTLTLTALDNAPANTISTVSFGDGTQALSVSGNSSYGENVIANTTPVSIQINKPQVSCGTSPGDSMMVMDVSGSMNDKEGSSGTKISNAISSANNFIGLVAGLQNNRVGLVSFADNGIINSPLTSDFASVTSQVNTLTANGGTCIQCGIDKANQEISAHKRPNIKNAVILLTDGLANRIESNGTSKEVDSSTAEQAALTAATAGHASNGTVFYTIGLGKDVDSDFLQKLATNTGGQYYFSPTTDQLNDIYNQISETLTGGTVTGKVFNDVNGDGVFEDPEPGLSGVLLQLYPLGSSTPQSLISTDSDGSYAIHHLCDGTYTVKQMVPTTWKQTLPSNIQGYSFTMSNGGAVSDKNFGDKQLPRCSDGIDNDGNGAADAADSTCHTDGNIHNPGSYDPNKDGEHGNSTCSDSKDNNGNNLIDGEDPICHVDGNANNPSSYDPSRDEGFVPTPTPTAAPTATPSPTVAPSPTPNANGTPFSVNILLHAIGNSGDNANPTASSLSNKAPLHPIRNATAYLYDINNTLAATAAGTVNYSSTSGSFTGTLYADTVLADGKYTVKVRSDTHLTKLIPGIITVSSTQSTVLPDVALVAGDANNDNRLDILDYNLLIGCYSDLIPAPDCNDAQKLVTDLNDDGNVNQFDYNLFLREISTQPGE